MISDSFLAKKGVKCYLIGIPRPDLESYHHFKYFRLSLDMIFTFWFFDLPCIFKKKKKSENLPSQNSFLGKKMFREKLLKIEFYTIKSVANIEISTFQNFQKINFQKLAKIPDLANFRQFFWPARGWNVIRLEFRGHIWSPLIILVILGLYFTWFSHFDSLTSHAFSKNTSANLPSQNSFLEKML